MGIDYLLQTIMRRRHRADPARPLPIVEVLEQRVMYSADALGVLAPLIVSEDTPPVDAAAVLELLEKRGDDSRVAAQGADAHRDDSDDTETHGSQTPLDLPDRLLRDVSDSANRSIVFVDHAVPDASVLLDAIDNERSTVVFIPAGEDGLAVISRTLAQYSELDAIHIVSHGSNGEISLGTSQIDAQRLLHDQSLVRGWASALSEDADIFLLGCDVARDTLGKAFVDTLAALTGADIAASTDLTGHTDADADWQLEYLTGDVRVDPLFDSGSVSQWHHVLAEITVDIQTDEFTIADGTTMSQLLAAQASGELVSLREALYAANQGAPELDTIILRAGTYSLTLRELLSDDDEGKNGDLDLRDDTLIIGDAVSGTTISQTQVFRAVLEVVSGSVELRDLTITGGFSLSEGGGIRAAASTQVTLLGSTVTQNMAQVGGGVYSAGVVVIEEGSEISNNVAQTQGGGVFIGESGTLEVSESTIGDNASRLNGGGIYALGPVHIQQSSVNANAVTNGSGGGISADDHLSVLNSEISDNSARNRGGGVSSNSTYDIQYTLFERNSAASVGGGVILNEPGTLNHVQFVNNTAGQDGGGLYANAETTLTNSLFERNDAGSDGGGMYAPFGSTIVDSGFRMNTATQYGGGLYADLATRVERTSFEGNIVTAPELQSGGTFDPIAKGGGIYLFEGGELEVINTTFYQNQAAQGGALYSLSLNSGSVVSSTFAENRTAASEFAANGSVSEGAAIWSDNGTVILNSSLFFNNTSDGVVSFGGFAGLLSSTGFNLYEAGFPSTHSTDIIDGVPALGPLTTVGYVGALPLLAGSDAINAGRATLAGDTDAHGVIRDEVADVGSSEADSDAAMLYWTDESGGIYRSNTEFGNVQLIESGLTSATDLVVDLVNARVLWLDNGASRVASVALDGTSTASDHIVGLTDVESIAIDSTTAYLYVGFAGANPRIEQYDSLGIRLATLAQGSLSRPVDLAVNPLTQRIYWAESGGSGLSASIRSTNLAGGDLVVHTEVDSPRSLSVNAEGTYAFWSEEDSDELWRLDLVSGQTRVHLSAPDLDPIGLSYDDSGDRLIWSSEQTDRISTIDSRLSIVGASYTHSAAVNDTAITTTSTLTAKPTLTVNNGLTVDEGAVGIVDESILLSTDTGANNVAIRFIITGHPTHGTLIVNGLEGATEFTQQQLDDELVSYRHNGSETFSDRIEFELYDPPHTSDRYRLQVTVTPINEAPQLNPVTTAINLEEADTYTISVADLGVSDPEGVDDSHVYRVVTGTQNGTVLVNQAELSTGDTFTHANLVAGQVAYRHNGDETSVGSVSLVVSDGELDSAPATLGFNITRVNDAPVLNPVTTPIDVPEANRHVLAVSDLGTSDAEGVTDSFEYRFTAEPVNGGLELSGLQMNVGDTFSHAELAAGLVAYRHNGDETSVGSVSLVVSDGELDSAPATLGFNITRVNDAPVLNPVTTPIDVPEANRHVLAVSDLGTSDAEGVTDSFEYRFTAEPVNGGLELNGLQMNVGDTFSHAELAAGLVAYRHNGDETFVGSVSLVVSDGELDSAPATLGFNITRVNDAPVLNPVTTPIDVPEANRHVLAVSDLGTSDAEGVTDSFEYRFTAEPVNGGLELSGLQMNDGDTFSHAELAAGLVAYRHNGDETSVGSVSLVVSDGELDSAPATLGFNITRVNDAPVLNPVTTPIDVPEANRHVLAVSDLGTSDAEGVTDSFEYRFTAEPVNGGLELSGLQMNDGDTFSHAELAAGLVAYRHNGDETSVGSVSLVVSDGELDSAPATLGFNITRVNDAPVLNPVTTPIDVPEANRHVLAVSDLGTSDAEGVTDSFEYRFTAEPVNGGLELNGLQMNVGDTFSHAELAAGLVAYRHNGDETSVGSVSLVVSDGELDSAPATLGFNITRVNDAPVLSITTNPAVAEGESYVFTEADLVASDVDNSETSFLYRYVSDLTAGQIELEGVLLEKHGTFTQAQLIAGQLFYIHNGGEVIADTIEFVVSDGLLDSSKQAVTFGYIPEDDRPSLVTPNTPLLAEGGNYRFSEQDLVVVDVDNEPADYRYRYTNGLVAGRVTLDGVTIAANTAFSHEQLIQGEVFYHHDGSETPADKIEFIVSSGDLDSPAATLGFNFTPVNDAPAMTLVNDTVSENSPGAIVGLVVVSDPDPGDAHSISVRDSSRFSVVDDTLVLNDDVAFDYEEEQELTVELTATDTEGASVTEQFLIKVLDVNDAPVTVGEIPESSAGDGFQLPAFAVIDMDGDEIQYSASLDNGDPLPAWLGFDVEEKAFFIIQPTQTVSELAVRINAVDGRGGQTSIPLVLLFDPFIASAKPVDVPFEAIELPQFTPTAISEVFTPSLPVDGTTEQANPVISSQTNDVEPVEAEVLNEHVDLHTLITPLSSFGSLELAVVDDAVVTTYAGSLEFSVENDIDTFNLADLLKQPSAEFLASSSLMNEVMERQSQDGLNGVNLSQTLLGSSAGLTTGLSLGYLLWLIRGGALMGSVLSSLPAWRFVDPLPVLSSFGEGDDDDDESLASMVNTDKDDRPDIRSNPADPILHSEPGQNMIGGQVNSHSH